ncbi:pullulanase [Halonatronum saccharophilum]|uniref:pullulanase n=1 Tax=Halonatronum saccharophilum TaxID=150060 RepID=UPI0004AE293F|nr:pullulanase [Halonatronum saccharophilum]
MRRSKILLPVTFLMVLFLAFGFNLNAEAFSSSPVEEAEEISDLGESPDSIRVHFQTEGRNYDGLGLWVWDGAETFSEELDEWPDGATAFDESQSTDYGPYVDVKLAEGADSLSFLVNESGGENLSGDMGVDILAADMTDIWIQEANGEYEVFLYEPVDLPENVVRVHYKHDLDSYEDWGLWNWGDVVTPSENVGDWPTGATDFSDDQVGDFGAYVDIEIVDNATQINFLAVNMDTAEQTPDMNVSNLSSSQLFFRAGDDNVYTNPYYVSEAGIETGEVLSDSIELRFSTTDGLTEEEIEEGLVLEDREGNQVSFDFVVIVDEQVVSVQGDFDTEMSPYIATFDERTATVRAGWRLIDEVYAYDGDLGVELHRDGTANLKLWSPGADNVRVILYDRDDQYEVVADDIDMNLGDRGVWEVRLDEENTGVADLTGYYYHYEIERDGNKRLALDPYAPSMAAWNNNPEDPAKAYPVGKAAIVNPSFVGPELDFAEIEGFERREDAIIYEVHVRDLTSDPSIEDELSAQFGTFAALVDKLDYIENLGVTHVQLLPIMSYFWGDELANDVRMMDWSASGNNYNWGYDPHSYFSITGMYSEDPNDAELRVEEFKNLIDEIHSRGMGVVLDVVYNHTARVHIFEDLVPNYYHFMDADGTSRTSFGGGRLGTTHEMARRILVDSILYWVEEFKVDGFRFDMMGDHDAESIQIAYDKAKEINPNIVMIGEGWRTFVGDEDGGDIMPADQDWMQHTESVGVFSDDFRNELKSGYGHEGEPRFITGGARDIQQIFDNVRANPHNFTATHPGDVVPYIEAHDNLTLHDVIAISIEKDPDYHQEEIQKRIRLGNTMVLTSQGTAFIHAGQEYGRTKQFRAETDEAPYKSHYGVDEDGEPFNYPYFIHDSYDSTDAINMFDWAKVREEGIHRETMKHLRGLVALRRSTDAFRLATMDLVESNVSMVESDDIADTDLVIGYRTESTDGEVYYIFINADDSERELRIDVDLTGAQVLVDAVQAGTEEIANPTGVEVTSNSITLDPLTPVVLKAN